MNINVVKVRYDWTMSEHGVLEMPEREDEYFAYIGRGKVTIGLQPSILRNPFSRFEYKEPAQLFRKWLWDRLKPEAEHTPEVLEVRGVITMLARKLIEYGTLNLACHCGHDRCHGHVVKKAVELRRIQILQHHLMWYFPISKTVMISGHMDGTPAEFDKHYKARLDAHMARGKYFIVGDCKGIDALAQKYLVKQGYPAFRVMVVSRESSGPRHCESDKFQLVAMGETYTERDALMTEHSIRDCLWIRPNRKSGGTWLNRERRQA